MRLHFQSLDMRIARPKDCALRRGPAPHGTRARRRVGYHLPPTGGDPHVVARGTWSPGYAPHTSPRTWRRTRGAADRSASQVSYRRMWMRTWRGPASALVGDAGPRGYKISALRTL